MTVNSLVNFGILGAEKTLAVRMKETTDKAVAAREAAEKQKRAEKAALEESKRKHLQSRAKEIFDEVLVEITEAAERGQHSYDYHYAVIVDDIRVQIIAEEARKNGFRTRFRSEQADMGDSAAPCVITNHWLEIAWGK